MLHTRKLDLVNSVARSLMELKQSGGASEGMTVNRALSLAVVAAPVRAGGPACSFALPATLKYRPAECRLREPLCITVCACYLFGLTYAICTR